MEKLDVEVARLSAQLAAGFGNVEHRLEDMRGQLTRVEAQVRLTNGRVTDLETANKIRAAVFADAAATEQKLQAAGGMSITRRDVTMVLAGGGALMAAWQFVSWALALLLRVS